MQELLEKGYENIFTPLKIDFLSSIKGGKFYVSLREVLNTERILTFQSLLKEIINF